MEWATLKSLGSFGPATRCARLLYVKSKSSIAAHEFVRSEVLRQGFEPRPDVLASLRATGLLQIPHAAFVARDIASDRSAPAGI